MADIKVGFIYPTLFNGSVKVVCYENAKKVTVKFLDTGFIKTTTASNIGRGMIKDPMRPRVNGVGFTGVGIYSTCSGGVINPAYKVWKSMLRRCYDDKFQKAHPTYKGCTVCDEWHNYQDFAIWYYKNHPLDGGRYELDKDLLIYGNKRYHPDACQFVTKAENNKIQAGKQYKLISPNGEEVDVSNLAKFCRDNDLGRGNMASVVTGKRRTHKGWTAKKIDIQ